jgi:hypothetical protein
VVTCRTGAEAQAVLRAAKKILEQLAAISHQEFKTNA